MTIKSRVIRTRSIQEIIDDSSPIDAEEGGSPTAFSTANNGLPEPIEFDSSLVPQSSPPEHHDDGRSPKRRRISIASSEPETELATSSPQQQQPENDFEFASFPDVEVDHITSYHSDLNSCSDDDDPLNETHPAFSPSLSPSPSIKPEPSSDPEGFRSSDEDEVPTEQPDEEDDQPPESSTPTRPKPDPNPHSRNHFHPAPRFKHPYPPGPTNPSRTDYLPPPDIFSPQRRGGAGGKYLPGGLAAELRDWLMDIKRADDEGSMSHSAGTEIGVGAGAGVAGRVGDGGAATGAVVRIAVEEVRAGGVGMTLVSGSVVGMGIREKVRVILAGEGNIEGLGTGRRVDGGRDKVGPGAVVGIAPPAWDVELDGRWAVAYRWEVVKGGRGE